MIQFDMKLGRTILVALLVLTVGATSIVAPAAAQSETADVDLPGSGMADDPYIITTAAELQTMENDLDAHYQLGADIDASDTDEYNDGDGFAPIGSDDETAFTGSFDGDGHTITGLTIDRPNSLWVGLFGYVDSAEIHDVTLANSTISGEEWVGELAGEVGDNSTITDVSVGGTVDGTEHVGGLVGGIGLAGDDSAITDVTASGTVNGSTRVGGLVGYQSVHGSVQNAEVTSITVTGETTVGGLVGYNSDTVKAVTASGTVDGGNETGGLVGSNEALNGEIIDATATTGVTGTNHVGGLVGGNGDRDGDELAKIRNASAHGTVDGQNYVGGFVGTNVGTIEEATATGTVTGDRLVGGFAGQNGNVWNEESSILATKAVGAVTGEARVGGHVGLNRRTVQNSFAAGKVTATGASGGFVATNAVSPLASADAEATANESYWDTEATGQSTSAGDVTGLTTAEMTGETALANMTDLFDFYWQSQADGYPVLKSRASEDSSEAALNISLSDSTITTGTETSVTVTVTDSGTGDPVEGATVEISDLQTSGSTNSTGVVILTVTPDVTGEYPVSVSADNYTDETVTLTVQDPTAETPVTLSNVDISPASVTTQQSQHTLTFDAVNISADGESDNFSVMIPQQVDLASVDSVETETSGTDPTVTTSGNTITFSVNPEGPATTVDLNISVDMTLSARE